MAEERHDGDDHGSVHPPRGGVSVVAALMVELVLLKGELTPASARSVLRMDMVYGIAALVLLVVGFVRVFHTEKGSDVLLR